MKKYVVYDKVGKIIQTGSCMDNALAIQAGVGEFVLEGIADDITQKVIDGKIVDKTTEEIKKDNPKPPEIPEEQKPVHITNGQWQDVLDRLSELEKTK